MNSQMKNDLDATWLIAEACVATISRRNMSPETQEAVLEVLRTLIKERKRVEIGA